MRHEMMLTVNLLGGYDNNLGGRAQLSAGDRPPALASASSGYLETAFEYFRGNAARSIRVESAGDLRAYPGYMTGVAAGGTAMVEAMARAGRDVTFRVSERVGYEPFFSVFSSSASAAWLPEGVGETAPDAGLFERHSLSSSTLASTTYDWGGQDSTTLSYQYRVQQFTSGEPFGNRSHEVLTEHRSRVTSVVKARAAYRYANGEYMDSLGVAWPTSEHRVEIGPEFEKALSRRRFTLSFAAGASYIESVESLRRETYRTWVPMGSGRAALQLSSEWAVEGAYRRSFSVLRGVSGELHKTDTASLGTGVLVAQRAFIRGGALYSAWRTPTASGVSDTFSVYGGSLDVSVTLTRKLAATAGYSYYHHRYGGDAIAAAGFPGKYDRHAVRAGFTVWLPLKGGPSLPRSASW